MSSIYHSNRENINAVNTRHLRGNTNAQNDNRIPPTKNVLWARNGPTTSDGLKPFCWSTFSGSS